jgi:hypothetical protein
MPAVAEHTRVAPPPTRSRARAARRSAPRGRLASGVVWIVVVALLLAGVVALNVAALRLNLRLDDLGRQRIELRGDTAELASKLSSASAAPRIEQTAQRDLGVVPADPAETTYLRLGR